MNPSSIQSSFLVAQSNQSNPESQLDKKMMERQELFLNESKISDLKEQAISSDLSLGNNEREKLFRSKRLKKTINIDSISSIADKLTIPKELYEHCKKLDIQTLKFPDLVQKIKLENNPNAQYEALVSFRMILSQPRPPIQEFIDFGLVSYIIAFLDHPYCEFNYEALWCLTNIACGTTDQTNSIAIKGGITKIVKLLDSTIEELLHEAIWTLGNLGINSDRIRQQIIDQKGLDKVIAIFQTTNRPLLIKAATFFISQLTRVKPELPYELIKKAIPLFIKHLFLLNEDVEYLIDACYILSYATEINKKCIDSIIETGILPIIFKCLASGNVYVQLSCLRIIGNIAIGQPNQTQALIDAGLLQHLKQLLFHEKRAIRKESTWILANIAAGTQRQIESLISEGYYPLLIQVIKNDVPDIQKEATWAICNMTSVEKKEMLEMLIREGILELLSFCLKLNKPNLTAVCLEALQNLLEFGKKYYSENGRNIIVTRIFELGMVDLLESLQFNPVEVIYEKTIKLLEKYFDTESAQ